MCDGCGELVETKYHKPTGLHLCEYCYSLADEGQIENEKEERKDVPY